MVGTSAAVTSVNAGSALCSLVLVGHPPPPCRLPQGTPSPTHTCTHRKYKLNKLTSPEFLIQRTATTILTEKCSNSSACLLHGQGQRRANISNFPTPFTRDEDSGNTFWSLLLPDGQAHRGVLGDQVELKQKTLNFPQSALWFKFHLET